MGKPGRAHARFTETWRSEDESFVQPKHREGESGPVYRGAQGAMHREIECVAPDFPGSVV